MTNKARTNMASRAGIKYKYAALIYQSITTIRRARQRRSRLIPDYVYLIPISMFIGSVTKYSAGQGCIAYVRGQPLRNRPSINDIGIMY